MYKNILLTNTSNIIILVKINELKLDDNGFYMIKGSIIGEKCREKVKQVYHKLEKNEEDYEKFIDNITILLPIKNGSITTDIYDNNFNRLCVSVLEKNDIIKTKIYLTNIKKENNIINFIWISEIVITSNKYEIESSSDDEDELIYVE